MFFCHSTHHLVELLVSDAEILNAVGAVEKLNISTALQTKQFKFLLLIEDLMVIRQPRP